MGWIQLVVALAPLLERLLAVAGPEVSALIGQLHTQVAANPQVGADLGQAAVDALTKLKGGKP